MQQPAGLSLTHTDVERALGKTLTEASEISQVNHWIDKCLLLIVTRLGPLESLDYDALRVVVPDAVSRMVRNPEGKSSERIDDYSWGFTGTASAGEITLTELEWAMLTPQREATAFTIRIGGAQ